MDFFALLAYTLHSRALGRAEGSSVVHLITHANRLPLVGGFCAGSAHHLKGSEPLSVGSGALLLGGPGIQAREVSYGGLETSMELCQSFLRAKLEGF